jgi:hypothetical protein
MDSGSTYGRVSFLGYALRLKISLQTRLVKNKIINKIRLFHADSAVHDQFNVWYTYKYNGETNEKKKHNYVGVGSIYGYIVLSGSFPAFFLPIATTSNKNF